MMYGSKLAFALVAATVIGSCAYSTPSSAQTTGGPNVSRCDMYRALGRQMPPECGGPPTDDVTRCGPRRPRPADDHAKAPPRSGTDVAGQKGAPSPRYCGG